MNKMAQRGQATTEFATMAVVLVPMFLLVPMLGKVSDLNQTTIQASRYAAWERTVSSTADKSNGQINAEIQRRLFSRVGTSVKTGEGFIGAANEQNPLWSGYGDSRLVASVSDDVALGIDEGGAPGTVSATVGGVLAKAGAIMGAFSSGAEWDLENDGLFTARVGTNVGANELAFYGNQNCAGASSSNVFTCITRQNVILADAWDSSDPGQVERRSKAFVPMGIFEKLTTVTDIVGAVPFLEEWGRFDPGYVAADVVPTDRLGKYDE